MKAGSLRHLITIYRQTIGSGAAGSLPKWDTVFATNVPASINPARASDVLRSGQIVSEVEIPISIRYMPGVLPNMRVKFQNTETPNPMYVIKGIINVEERNREMTLMCVGLGIND